MLCIYSNTPCKLRLNIITYFTENIAFNKSAWKQGGIYGADRAIDGRKSSLSVYGWDCVPQQHSQTAEWRVDLGGILNVHHILIQYATNNEAWGMSFS